jgi:hypothetical protein
MKVVATAAALLSCTAAATTYSTTALTAHAGNDQECDLQLLSDQQYILSTFFFSW